LGVEPHTLAAELDRIDSGTKFTTTHGQQLMNAVLFHPETSMRRALILALGTYGTGGLFVDQRTALIAKLLDLYLNDPDSGIHGAAEWTLRQWKQEDQLKELDAKLIKATDRGERRWYINGQGQTFTVIADQVKIGMGSPPTELDGDGNSETPHERVIPRRFAIAASEVSVARFRRFRPEHEHFSVYSPHDDGPVNGISWYLAAEYCNWLSRQEGKRECYEPNDRGEYGPGMKIKSNALHLEGYRLPTEAEWKYACRAGTETSRPHGASPALLGEFAWYNATSEVRAWSCGRLQPNELGLFDMLGNVSEWCQEAFEVYQPSVPFTLDASSDRIILIDDAIPRRLRGGTFDRQPGSVRPACRSRYLPSNRAFSGGFRPARTLP
jgi:formylglycine-generating enzyme required for sulfatase activity